MNPEAAKQALIDSVNDDEPAVLSPGVLKHLTIADVPDGARYEVGTKQGRTIKVDWNGSFTKVNGKLHGEADHTWTRKYWYSPLGLEQYLDLVRRAVELRQRVQGDVALIDYDDDGAYIHLRYQIVAGATSLDEMYAKTRKIDAEIVETANQAADDVGARIADVAARLSG